jgi:hypothetical protein
MKLIKSCWIGIIIVFVYFFVLFFTLKDYGIHEDSPFHFLRGQAYLQKILTGDSKFAYSGQFSPVFFAPFQRISLYKPNASEEIRAPLRSFGTWQTKDQTIQALFSNSLNKLNQRQSFYKHNIWTADYWDTIDRSHPAISDIFMALSNRIFYEGLGWMSDIEAYNLYVIIAVCLGLFFVYLFCQKVFGTITAIFSILTLAFFPYFFAESHFNVKDPVQMSFFTIAIIAFYFWVINKFSRKWWLILVSAIFLALGTKWNVVFLPLILLPWLWLLRKQKELGLLFKIKKLLFWGALTIAVPFILLINLWPYLWTSPISKLLTIFGFYGTLAVQDAQFAKPSFAPLPLGFDGRALIYIISMTPPIMLIFFIVGLLVIVFKTIKSAHKENILILLWLIVPLLRVIWQQSAILGSIRNFIEYLVPFSIIAGIGISYLISLLKEKFSGFKNLSFIVFLTGYLIIISLPIIKLHPNENLYFNFLVNNLVGAEKIGAYSWMTSYDNLYRQGVDWFNRHAPKNAQLAYLDGTMIAISPLWLRSDIRFGSFYSGFDRKGEYVISLVYPDPPSISIYYYLERFLNPVYEIKVDGVAVLKIWKNDPHFLKSGYAKEKILENIPPIEKKTINKRIIWDLNFGKKEKITRLILKVAQNNCVEKEGIWSVILGKKEQFFEPYKKILGQEKVEYDFAGDQAETVRFWDVEGKSCLYQAEVDQIYGL